eukprot:678467-Pleurochrysis_carterae.AAC.2
MRRHRRKAPPHEREQLGSRVHPFEPAASQVCSERALRFGAQQRRGQQSVTATTWTGRRAWTILLRPIQPSGVQRPFWSALPTDDELLDCRGQCPVRGDHGCFGLLSGWRTEARTRPCVAEDLAVPTTGEDTATAMARDDVDQAVTAWGSNAIKRLLQCAIMLVCLYHFDRPSSPSENVHPVVCLGRLAASPSRAAADAYHVRAIADSVHVLAACGAGLECEDALCQPQGAALSWASRQI